MLKWNEKILRKNSGNQGKKRMSSASRGGCKRSAGYQPLYKHVLLTCVFSRNKQLFSAQTKRVKWNSLFSRHSAWTACVCLGYCCCCSFSSLLCPLDTFRTFWFFGRMWTRGCRPDARIMFWLYTHTMYICWIPESKECESRQMHYIETTHAFMEVCSHRYACSILLALRCLKPVLLTLFLKPNSYYYFERKHKFSKTFPIRHHSWLDKLKPCQPSRLLVTWFSRIWK